MRPLIFIGASGHGKVCADIARLSGYENIHFLDDDKNITFCDEYEVIGITSDLVKYVGVADFFVSIGDTQIRQKITEDIRKIQGKIITLIHPMATIAKDIRIGDGCVIMAGTVINSGTVLGDGVIVNTGSTVDHDCMIGDFVHVAPGCHVSGNVFVGKETWIGVGSAIVDHVSLCSECIIGAGTVVIDDIKEKGIYIGVPAKKIKNNVKR